MPKAKASTKKKKAPKIIATGDDAMKLFMAMLADSAHEKKGDAVAEAQNVMYKAWDASRQSTRITLAKKALKISADCADAYVLLGSEEAKTPQEALVCFRKGVEAGERALGKKAFKEDAGYFWGILETRPYMRARHHLAAALWNAGEREEALSHYRDMLRLNPNDNQGIRYVLLAHLLFLGKDKEAAALHKTYKKDCMADWAWSKVLLSFRMKKDSPESRKALDDAVKTNRHVAVYLLGRKALPKTMPPYISPGNEDEAVAYVDHAMAAWKAAPGALEWVEKALHGLKPKRAA